MMFQAVDTAMTYAAELVLFGSFVYFPIAFLVYAWQAETKHSDNARVAVLEARLDERRQALATIEAEIADGLGDAPGDEDAIATSGVPSLEVSPHLEVPVALEETALMVGDEDAGAGTSTEEPANVPLPTLERTSLTIWARRGEQVVTTGCIPIPLPDDIKRFRWRKAEVIRLADLETIAQIV